MVMAGALPFGAVFIELFFILESLFENEFYYMFGMDLHLDVCVRPLASPESPVRGRPINNPIKVSYFWFSSLLSLQLPKYLLFSFTINFAMKVRPRPWTKPSKLPWIKLFSDHCWMWKSFISGGGISLYVFGYLIYYHIVKLDITSFTPIVLYFR